DETGGRKLTRENRSLKLAAFDERIRIDRSTIDVLRFVGVDRKDEFVASLKAREIECYERPTIMDDGIVYGKTVGASDGQSVEMKRSQPAGSSIEKDVAVREAVLAFVAV